MDKTNRLATFLTILALAMASATAKADVAARWATIAAETSREAREAPASAERRLAAVQQAIAAAGGAGNGNGGDKSHAEHRDAAIAVAAFAVLEALYPAQRETLEAQLALTFSYLPETDAKAAGAAHGRSVATRILGSVNAR